eukprot:gene24155-biopygen1333
MIPYDPVRVRTIPGDSVRFRTIPYDPVQFRTVPHDSTRFRTITHIQLAWDRALDRQTQIRSGPTSSARLGRGLLHFLRLLVILLPGAGPPLFWAVFVWMCPANLATVPASAPRRPGGSSPSSSSSPYAPALASPPSVCRPLTLPDWAGVADVRTGYTRCPATRPGYGTVRNRPEPPGTARNCGATPPPSPGVASR